MVYSVGIPIKLLHEAQGLIVTAELKTGQLYRGRLVEVEDCMNVQLRDVTVTARDGRTSTMEQCFLRGGHIRFIVLPDNLRHAPMFKAFTSKDKRGKGMGIGRAEALAGTSKLPRTSK